MVTVFNVSLTSEDLRRADSASLWKWYSMTVVRWKMPSVTICRYPCPRSFAGLYHQPAGKPPAPLRVGRVRSDVVFSEALGL